MRILLVEDDPDLARQIRRLLEQEGYAVDHAADGPLALEMGRDAPYAAVILDPGVPGMDGLTVLKRWRNAGLTMPVIVLTASRTEVSDMREGVRAGATNYLLKPVDSELLLDWVRGVVNSAGPNSRGVILERGDLRIDTVALKVWLGDDLLRLTPTEYRILLCLTTADGRPMQAQEIVERGFDAESTKTAAEIPVYVSRLRDKLGRTAIETVHGFGYRLADEVNRP
ncbi:MAG: response regulator transcription factor [Geminicoccaceae bacterium]|nr:response regulator transcription factor [Geminicoccaceae bacterium]MCB9944799.1 response regulator transcription factor [Geminicoccaceae bacterium]